MLVQFLYLMLLVLSQKMAFATIVYASNPFIGSRLLCSRPVLPLAAPRAAATIRMTSSSSKSPSVEDTSLYTDADWREKLTPEEYYVLRQKGTERPGTGEYDGFYPKTNEAYFACRACMNPLYSASSKFASGCGWPAFDKCYKGAIDTKVDVSFGMKRIEILCNNCGGHLGHVFEGERMTPTNQRHCVNSVSIKYVEGKVDLEEGKV